MIPIKAFISFSSKDEAYKNDFITHLSPLARKKKITLWDSQKLHAGLQWDKKIRQQIEAAHLILFLVSPDSLASDYINDVEISRALERCKEGSAILIPIILRPCDWHEHMDLAANHLAAPMYGKAISKWPDKDEAYVDVVRQIKFLLESEEVKELITKGQFRDSTINVSSIVTNVTVDSLKKEGKQLPKKSIENYQEELLQLIGQNKLSNVLDSLSKQAKDNTAHTLFLSDFNDLKEELQYGIITTSDSRYSSLKWRIIKYVKGLKIGDVKFY